MTKRLVLLTSLLLRLVVFAQQPDACQRLASIVLPEATVTSAARVEYRQMHFLGPRNMPMGELHEASFLQKSDVRHALFLGSGLGIVGGMVLGLYLKLTPIGSYTFDVGTLILCTIGGGLFGVWASTLIGVSTPNTQLKPFEKDIEDGKILMMVDVPVSRAPSFARPTCTPCL